MPRILFLTPQLPYIPVSGGVIKSWKMIEFLANRHEVYLLSLLKGNDYLHVESLQRKVKLTNLYATQVNISRSAINFIRSIFAGIPLSVYRNWSSDMQSKVLNVIDWAEVVFVDHFLMFQYVPESFGGRIVLHQHNAEYLMWERFSAIERNIIRQLISYLESKRIRSYEAFIGKRSHAVLASPNDIEALISVGIPRERFIETLHLGDEELLGLPNIDFSKTAPILLFVGSLDWEANRDGVHWFLRKVWPILATKHPNLRFTIIGRNPCEDLMRDAKKHPGVKILGFVDDLEPYYTRSRVFVAPLRFGSGIKVKVVNALYRGLPVSTTSIGAEGLFVESGHEMLIADQVPEMVEQISSILTNKSQWEKMRDSGRELARKKYTWQTCLERVEKSIYG